MKNLIPSIPILIAVLFSARGAEEVRFAQVGETVTLTPTRPNEARYLYWSCCNQNEVANLNPIASSWTIAQDEKKSRMSVSTSNSALTIKQLRDEDFVTYTFSKLVGNNKVSVDTFTLYPITLDVNPSSPLLIGESLSVTCNAKTPQNLHRKPEIYLLNPQGQKVKTGPGTMSTKATRQHNGNWTCVVKYNQKQYSATVPVTVLDLSPASSSYQYASYSSPLTIPCSIFPQLTLDQIKARGIQEVHWQFYSKPSVGAGDPKTLFSLSLNKLEWKPNRLPSLNPVPAQKGNFSLTKRKDKQVDRGDYVCMAKFEKDVTLQTRIHVEVLEIIAYPGKNLTSGQQLHLICGIGLNMSSDLQLKWVPPEQSLQSDLVHANFTITEVSTRDSGKWRCELWQGSTKLTSEEITLKIEPKLSAWMLVIICSAAAIVVLLLVLVFILCRRRQRKMRHPRHRLCQCKSPKPKGFYKT